ncbi:MAG: biotin/lipoyl-containing protein [Thermoplasmata archaeon]
MRFNLRIDGKPHDVELEIGRIITIRLDGETFQAQVEKTRNGLKVKLDKKVFLVEVKVSEISVNGTPHSVEVRDLRRGKPSWSYATSETDEVGAGKPLERISKREGMIYPPMPGRVVSIKVKEGDFVKVGSPIIILEAMKMQNEIASPVEGKVKEVRAKVGSLVDVGDVLALIE